MLFWSNWLRRDLIFVLLFHLLVGIGRQVIHWGKVHCLTCVERYLGAWLRQGWPEGQSVTSSGVVLDFS